ncbi:MAG: glycosyltransferase [Candidatus Omnitrophica bacterium]|nr:glycosyltransferase [Candidatus Omnitrophota bacterium]
MSQAKTAVLIQPGLWTSPPGENVSGSFSTYRLIGKPECDMTGFPPSDSRSLPTDHIGNALRTILIENQDRGEDVWVYHSQSLWGRPMTPAQGFRQSLISVVGVREVENPKPILCPFQPRDLTVLPWETLRFIDFRKLDWVPNEDYLLTYARHANRRGFSPYLAPVECSESEFEDIGDFLVESKTLELEDRLFHRHKILSALKGCPIHKENALSLLVDLTHIRNGYNGTMEYGRNLFKGILNVHKETPFGEVKAIGEARHVEFHGISRDCLIDRGDSTVFDVCFRPYQIDNPEIFADIVFRGRRFVISQLDAIGSRCDYIYDSTMRFYQEMGMAASDGVVCISEYGLKDAVEFFHVDPEATPCRAFLLAMEPSDLQLESPSEHGQESYMVIGSWRYDHKMLRPALEAVRAFDQSSNRSITFHFLGDLSEEKNLPECVRYHKHNQTQEELDRLFSSVQGFIFPSVYEGYGLPIMHAFRFNKPILIADTEVNREIQSRFEGPSVSFFPSEQEFPQALETFVRSTHGSNSPSHPRNWDQVARETLAFLAEIAIGEPVENPRRRQARESLLMAASQLTDLPETVSKSGWRRKPNLDSKRIPAKETPMHSGAPRKKAKSILPKPLAEAWVEHRDRLPSSLVRFLKAVRKRIPDGT